MLGILILNGSCADFVSVAPEVRIQVGDLVRLFHKEAEGYVTNERERDSENRSEQGTVAMCITMTNLSYTGSFGTF